MWLRTIVCHCLMLASPTTFKCLFLYCLPDSARMNVSGHIQRIETIRRFPLRQVPRRSVRPQAFSRKGGLLHAIAVSFPHRISHFVEKVAVPVSIYRLSTPSEPWRCKTSHAPMREPAQRNGTFGMRHCWWHDTRSWWKPFLHLSSKLGARFYSFPSWGTFKHGWVWIIYHVAPFTM